VNHSFKTDSISALCLSHTADFQTISAERMKTCGLMLVRGRVTVLQYVLLVSTFFSHYRNSVNYYRLLKQTANFPLLCSKNVKKYQMKECHCFLWRKYYFVWSVKLLKLQRWKVCIFCIGVWCYCFSSQCVLSDSVWWGLCIVLCTLSLFWAVC